MEDLSQIKVSRNEYFRIYQQNRYALDPEFREKTKLRVKERYYRNKLLLMNYKNKLKEDS